MKEKIIVRIESVEIESFKNVVYGKLDLTSNKQDYNSSVLGLYGQNGSGKTTLIDGLLLLKKLLMGLSIEKKYFDCININSQNMKMTYRISIKNEDFDYFIIYSVSLKKEDKLEKDDMHDDELFNYIIESESLSISKMIEGKITSIMTPWIETNFMADSFGPKAKYDALIEKDKSVDIDILVAKKIANKECKSFVFSKELYEIFKKNCKHEEFLSLYNSLKIYGFTGLLIFDNKSTAYVSLDALPMAFSFSNEKGVSAGQILLPINGQGIISKDEIDVARKIIDNMNIVLQQLVPGLTIGVKKFGEELLKDGSIGYKIQLLSNRESKQIPLCFESDGINKIVSILQLLIAVYNKSSITVAIDELDSGIFEYLLGEMLRIISNKGLGQLIFTSHNLRPLETLDKSSIAFTTTNQKNRYRRLANVKKTNNLRDLYYRNIFLEESYDDLYDSTNNADIALAFKEAGEYIG